MVSINDESPAAPQRMLKLSDAYDGALLGHTLDPLGPPRHVYSLTKGARIHGRIHHLVAPEDAAESFWNFIKSIAAEHGERMPVFVEDSEMHSGPKIYTGG